MHVKHASPGDKILIFRPEYLQSILAGAKTLEIRGTPLPIWHILFRVPRSNIRTGEAGTRVPYTHNAGLRARQASAQDGVRQAALPEDLGAPDT